MAPILESTPKIGGPYCLSGELRERLRDGQRSGDERASGPGGAGGGGPRRATEYRRDGDGQEQRVARAFRRGGETQFPATRFSATKSWKTGEESTAKLVFLDSTNLAVGPISRVVLDKFVYDEGGSGQTVAVKLSKGLFRFTTGALDKNAYSVTTPTAAIGVRGTVLDISVVAAKTKVTLREGKAIVCPVEKGSAFEQLARDCTHGKGANCRCTELDQVGETVEMSRKGSGSAVTQTLTSAAVNFAALCTGSLCEETDYATLAHGSTDFAEAVDGGGGGAALCGR